MVEVSKDMETVPCKSSFGSGRGKLSAEGTKVRRSRWLAERTAVPGRALDAIVGRVRGLGIDFGTSSTVAVLRHADGRVALYLGRSRPERLELNPKRRIDEGAVLLGAREVPGRGGHRGRAAAGRGRGHPDRRPRAWDTVVSSTSARRSSAISAPSTPPARPRAGTA
jgi:hypothetical protein